MEDNVIHRIEFRVGQPLQVSNLVGGIDPEFTFDSTTHFFSDDNWHFSDKK